MYEIDEEVYTIKEKWEESGDNCERVSSSIIWWDTCSCKHKTAQRKNGSATEPDICNEVKGLHFGQIGEDQVLWGNQMLCYSRGK